MIALRLKVRSKIGRFRDFSALVSGEKVAFHGGVYRTRVITALHDRLEPREKRVDHCNFSVIVMNKVTIPHALQIP